MDNCVFCKIVAGEIPNYTIWEDENHLAFLSPFPNTEGFSVVIPKEHHPSYAFAQSDEVLSELVLATKKVAQLLDNHFPDVARSGMFFEGWGIDHLHTKLFPMHGTGKMEEWKKIESTNSNAYFETYPGYLSSNDSLPADHEDLAELAKNIRQTRDSRV